MKVLLYILLILFLTNIAFAQDTESKTNSYLSSIVKIRPKRGTPKLKFEVYRFYDNNSKEKNDYDIISEIKIYNTSKDNLIQTIDKETFGYAVQFEFDDYNFDGYKDIYIKDGCAILNNCFGNIFLYTPSTGKFELAKEFKDLTTIQISKSKKRIYSINRSAGGALWSFDVYKYINNKLTLIISESQDTEPLEGKYHYIKTIRNTIGKMETIINKTTTEPRFEPDIPK